MDTRRDAGEFYPGGKVISTRPLASGGDVKHSEFEDLDVKTNTIPDLREAVRELGRRLGATVVTALAACVATAATVQTVPVNDLDFDANPSVVTNVVFDAPPDFSTNNVALVETIEAKAPTPDLSPFLRKTGDTMTGALTVQENLTVGSGSATGENSVAEGWGIANGNCSHAEGNSTAEGDYSHAEGFDTITTVFGIDAHAEGSSTTANGYASHAEGGGTTANGEYSHVEGEDTTAQNDYEHAQGRFNASHKSSGTFGDAGNTLSSIGFGTADGTRKNAVETMQDGKTFIYGLGGYDGTNPTNGVKDLVAAIESKADAADIPEWATAPTKPTYTASEVGAYSTNETMYVDYIGDVGCIYGDYMPSGVWDFGDGCIRLANWYQFNLHMPDGRQADGIEIFDTADPTIKTVIPINGSDVATIADIPDVPESVSNTVTTALIRERLGAWMEYDEATGLYYYCHEEE